MTKTINLYLLSKKGLAVLQQVVSEGKAGMINNVVIAQDSNTLNDYSAEIKKLCIASGISWGYRGEISAGPADYNIAISWRWMIRETENLIVFHDSILPAYRGFAPLVNQLVNGEREIGVTALFASEEYDKGEIIQQVSSQVTYPITIREAIDVATDLYKNLIAYVLGKIAAGEELERYVQDEGRATYSLWRDEDDYFINWNQDASQIERFVNAVGFPYSGARSRLNDQVIQITGAKAIQDVDIMNRDIGKLIFIQEGFPVVVCGAGLLKITVASYLDTNESILPLKKFRSRFS